MKNDPIERIENWLAGAGRGMAASIALSFGIKSDNETEALLAIGTFMRSPRTPHERLAAVLSLRAVIDFDCWRFGSPEYHDLLDANLQYAADAGSIPKTNRMAVNEFLGTRPQAREEAMSVSVSWWPVRLTEQSIFEWWWFAQSSDMPPASPQNPTQ